MSEPRPEALPAGAFTALEGPAAFRASVLTRGPWHPDHQHAGPPIALVCRAVELAARPAGLSHVARITTNLLRPVPIGELLVEVAEDYVGRNAAHYSARLLAAGKEVARFTALAQREGAVPLPEERPEFSGHERPRPPAVLPPAVFPFASRQVGYSDLVETRLARGRMFDGPCAVWFRLRHPLVEGEPPSPYQRVAVAADSGNGISAMLDYRRYSFVNSDLTINLMRPPRGEWICVDARSHVGPNGCGLAESVLFDEDGMVGIATQSLAIRLRE